MTWDSLVEEFNTNEFLCWSLSLLLSKSLLTDKLSLIEFNEHTKASHNRSDVCRELIAIKRQTNLKAQCIATTQSASLNTSSYQFIPALVDVLMRAVYLKSILASISGTRDDDIANRLTGVECHLCAWNTKNSLNCMLCLRALNGYLTIVVTTVLQVNIESFSLLLHPRQVLIDIGGVDDKEEVVLAHLVYQQVVDSTTILVAHHTIVYLTYWCSSDIIGENMLHVALCILALNCNLAHV